MWGCRTVGGDGPIPTASIGSGSLVVRPSNPGCDLFLERDERRREVIGQLRLSESAEPGLVEGQVNDFLAGFVQIRLDRLEGRLPTDGHHDAGIHALVDEEALGEPALEVVARDVAKVLVAGAVGGGLGGPAASAVRRTTARTPPVDSSTYGSPSSRLRSRANW